MKSLDLKRLIAELQNGTLSREAAEAKLRQAYKPSNHAKEVLAGTLLEHEDFIIDLDRETRTGIPEVIFAHGKSPEQVTHIVSALARAEHRDLLLSRVTPPLYRALKKLEPTLALTFVYHALAKILYTQSFKEHALKNNHAISTCTSAVITAGTSDIPVAEEAAVILECMGTRVKRIYDVGVASLNRLFKNLAIIQETQVAIVIAGMDGVLPSVLGGLVSIPVIAVPSSVGYGAHFNGLAPLLTMLNACAPGVTVVNIDNGFGAAVLALKIFKTFSRKS